MRYTAFEWDAAKARSNLRKHGVSFQNARSLFDRPHLAKLQLDEASGEERWVAIGWIKATLGVVVFTERVSDAGTETIRIISARKASNRERTWYEKAITN